MHHFTQQIGFTSRNFFTNLHALTSESIACLFFRIALYGAHFCMMATKGNMDDLKYLAQILYTREYLEQKTIAKRLKVTEKSISKWVNEGGWKEMRKRLLLTKQTELGKLYTQLEKLNEAIEGNGTGYPNTKEADIQRKLTATIRELETELGIAEIVESGIRFLKHLQMIAEPEKTLEVADFWNSFVQASIKR